MARGKMDQGVAFAADMLRKDPDATMAQIRAEAAKAGISVYPVIVTKARAKLGMSGKGRGGRRKKAGARGAGRPRGTGKGTGRSRGSGGRSVAPGLALEGIVEHIRALETELQDLRARLDQISGLASGG